MEWPWPKVIALADMNAYFASVEQKDNPKLRGKPVVVTNGMVGHTIVASSYEAKRFGINTGMSLLIAKKICPILIRMPSRPERYSELTGLIMAALSHNITPDIEVFSIDEAFLDITGVAHRYSTPHACAIHIQQVIWNAVKLPCSIGLSGNKTMSKFAAKQRKPKGITIIYPMHAKKILSNVPVEQLCGIGEGMRRFLAKYGVRYCGQIDNLPIGIIRQRFGYLGQKIWWMCHGIDHDFVRTKSKPEKTMGHSKVIPVHLHSESQLLSIALHLTHRLTLRLKHRSVFAQKVSYYIKTHYASTEIDIQFSPAVRDTDIMFKPFRTIIMRARRIRKIGLLAKDLCDERQRDFDFDSALIHTGDRTDIKAAIQKKFGGKALQEARLLLSDPVRVISPSWRST